MKAVCGILFAAFIFSSSCMALDNESMEKEFEQMKRDLAELRKDRAVSKPIVGYAENALDNKYGPNADVTTRTGKLAISGLVQTWYYNIQHDRAGLFAINGFHDTNDAVDNSSFYVRRIDMIFDMDVNENVSSRVWFDPSRDITSFPSFPSNQGLFKRGINTNLAAVQTGAGTAGRILMEAWINYHGVVPHHDFQIGQFRPALGEEGIRSNALLDFCERSFIGQLTTNRDLGIQAHGTWWNDRIQYWLGAFDGAGNYFLSAGQTQNRPDDNNAKDLQYRVQVRPLWKDDKWGSLELSMASMGGEHGGGGTSDPISNPTLGLNRKETDALRHYAHAYYAPGSIVKGWWVRGEWAWIKDRNAPSTVPDLTGIDPHKPKTGLGFQTLGHPFVDQGWYVSTGYKMSDSIWFNDDCHSAPSWLKPFELAFRYETFGNVQVDGLVDPMHTDVFKTSVFTSGINYYIKGHNAKIQLNYNIVDNPEGSNALHLRKVRNNNFIINFQVYF